jgi:signal transduction histidine kinase
MTAEADGAHEARHELYRIMERDAEFETKARQALELGEAYLRVDNGHMTVIDPASDYWEAIASSGAEEYSVGTVLDLQQTFCRKAIEREESLALHDVPSQGWEGDPAFEATGLHAYHGTAIELREDLYGTVCFVSRTPRAEPFTEEETLFAELIARMLEYERSCARYESELERRADLLDVVNRVLRHNLRNDLNYVRGAVRMLSEDGDHSFDTEPVVETVEGLLELAETARQLDSVVRRDTEFARRNLVSMAAAAAEAVEREYPEASITVDGAGESTVLAKSTLRSAIRELLENAVKHGGGSGTIVGVERTDDGVDLRVADGGDGLPAQERTVLTTGNETPLVHGSGLGLWMVYWIVTDHGGSADVTVDERGTTITLSLPHNPLTGK